MTVREQKRIVVVLYDEFGGEKLVEMWNVSIDEHIQDDGNTLKLFLHKNNYRNINK